MESRWPLTKPWFRSLSSIIRHTPVQRTFLPMRFVATTKTTTKTTVTPKGATKG